MDSVLVHEREVMEISSRPSAGQGIAALGVRRRDVDVQSPKRLAAGEAVSLSESSFERSNARRRPKVPLWPHARQLPSISICRERVSGSI